MWCLAGVRWTEELILIFNMHRFAGYLYEPEGKGATERLWKETLSELEFAKVGEILTEMTVPKDLRQ